MASNKMTRVRDFIRSLRFDDNGDVEKARLVYLSEDGGRTLTTQCEKYYSDYELRAGQTAKYLANGINFVNHRHRIKDHSSV